jgi:hypothetical protein
MPNINPDGYAITFEGNKTGHKNPIYSLKIGKFYVSKFSTVIEKINVTCALQLAVDIKRKFYVGIG